MCKLIISMIILISAAVSSGSPQREISGFTFIGKSESSLYYLSNVEDKRNVSDALWGCDDNFPGGQLVMLETKEERDFIRKILIGWGHIGRDPVWTAGKYVGDNWVWYDSINHLLIPIQSACEQPWFGAICPNNGCLAIGVINYIYGWEADNCNMKRQYLCEKKDDTFKNQ